MNNILHRAICRNCEMRLEFTRHDFEDLTMNNGEVVRVKSYTCPKCDEKFIVAVYDKESNRLRNLCNDLQDKLKDLYESQRTEENSIQLKNCRLELENIKELMWQHDKELKQKFLKEMKRHGSR